jgi:hypothetical protein
MTLPPRAETLLLQKQRSVRVPCFMVAIFAAISARKCRQSHSRRCDAAAPVREYCFNGNSIGGAMNCGPPIPRLHHVGHPLAVSAFRSRAACRLSRAGSNGCASSARQIAL